MSNVLVRIWKEAGFDMRDGIKSRKRGPEQSAVTCTGHCTVLVCLRNVQASKDDVTICILMNHTNKTSSGTEGLTAGRHHFGSESYITLIT